MSASPALEYAAPVRVALVSPYSHGYPGGVARHVEALAGELLARGHEVRLLAPHDPDDRLARLLHRGLRPQRRSVPDYLVPLGRTVAIGANGARSNLGLTLDGVVRLSRELRRGRFDVVHVHEPNAPLASWCAVELARAPLVGTFHAHSTSRTVNLAAANVVGGRRLYNKLGVRIAVSEAARWTAERFYGGRYRVVPNGVDLAAAPPTAEPRAAAGSLRVLYLGRAEERKGLPVLLSAFAELRATGVDAHLTVAGADPRAVRKKLADLEAIELSGPVSEHEKWGLLGDADVLCAPSLRGESFGMVLIEALAAGTPVVCSDIAGYRELVGDGREGAVVPAGCPQALAAALRGMAGDPGRRGRIAQAARARAERFAWPRVADEVIAAYGDAISLPEPEGPIGRAGARLGLRGADRVGSPRDRRRGLDDAQPPNPRPVGRFGSWTGAVALAPAAVLVVLALGGSGLLGSAGPVVDASVWPLAAVALMVAALLSRAEAWNAILRASLPAAARVARRGTARATMIGVVMSATLPARLGEVARSLVVAGRIGRVQEELPFVAGTIVSQTALNLLALGILGTTVLATGLAHGSESGLALATLVPAVGLVAGVAATAIVRGRRGDGKRAPLATAGAHLARLRRGLVVLRRPRSGAHAVAVQLGAWALQLLACYALLVAFGLEGEAGLGGAAAVLFAVNATAALPGLPANIGVFQAACVAALAAHGVVYGQALAYGISLQALELAVAVALGVPAMVAEGVGWREMRERAVHATAPRGAAPARAYNRRPEIFDFGR